MLVSSSSFKLIGTFRLPCKGGGGRERQSFFLFFFIWGGGGEGEGEGEEDIRASLFQSGLSSVPGFFITLAPRCTSFNPLNLMSDQDRIFSLQYLHNINQISDKN